MPDPVTIGNATLYLGDCLEILPTLGNVDAVVTDPPYGIDGGRGGDAWLRQKASYGGTFTDDEHYIEIVCVPVIRQAIEMAERVALTPGTRCLHLYPRPADIGCFYHPAALAHGPWGFVGFSPILYYGRDYRAGIGSLPSSITVIEAPPKVDHPCPKPMKAWKWLVGKASQVDEVVLDPFMGSGTTGVACAKLGRKFIGIEIEPKYFDIACRRIEESYRQPDMFIEPPRPAVQEALL